jgi:hypothetical protein
MELSCFLIKDFMYYIIDNVQSENRARYIKLIKQNAIRYLKNSNQDDKISQFENDFEIIEDLEKYYETM